MFTATYFLPHFSVQYGCSLIHWTCLGLGVAKRTVLPDGILPSLKFGAGVGPAFLVKATLNMSAYSDQYIVMGAVSPSLFQNDQHTSVQRKVHKDMDAQTLHINHTHMLSQMLVQQHLPSCSREHA